MTETGIDHDLNWIYDNLLDDAISVVIPNEILPKSVFMIQILRIKAKPKGFFFIEEAFDRSNSYQLFRMRELWK